MSLLSVFFRKGKKSSLSFSSPMARTKSDGVILAVMETFPEEDKDTKASPSAPLCKAKSIGNLSPPLIVRKRSASDFAKHPIDPPNGDPPAPRTRSNSDNFDGSGILLSKNSGYRDEYYENSKDMHVSEADHLRAWQPVLQGGLPPCQAETSHNLQFLIRKGVPDSLRGRVWKMVSGCTEFMQDNPHFFQTMLHLAFGPKVPSSFRHVPSFGGVISPSEHFLSDEGLIVLKRLLCIFGMMFPEIEYCPTLPDAILICLMFLSEADACATVHVMVKKTKSIPRFYFNTSLKERARFSLTFDRLVQRHLWSLHKHMSHLGIDSAHDFADNWFSRLFVSFLPYQTVLRIFDVYINEGSKILYKTGLAILSLNMDKLMRFRNKRSFLDSLHKLTHNLTDADHLIKTAYTFRMKDHNHKLGKKDIKILESIREPAVPVYYRPKVPLNSNSIGDEQFEILWGWVPRRYCIQDPVLIFSTDIHGCSLTTFYRLCSRVAPSVLAIKTRDGSVFGAYVSDPWIATEKPVYYSDGECFMWSLSPDTHHWPWTGKNDYFMMAARSYIAVGGNGYALWINHAFDFCMSSACETFGSPPLHPGPAELFECVTVEVFGFQ